VRVQSDAESQLTAAQRSALRRWRAFRQSQTGDFPERPPQAPLRASTLTGLGRSTLIALSVQSIVALGLVWIWIRRGPAWRPYAALGVATGLAVAGAGLAGRWGPGARILVQHATTIEQVDDGALVSMRGTVEYPAFADYTLRMLGVDGDVLSRPSGTAEQWLDATGISTRHRTAGRGRREEIEIDGVTSYAPFRILREGNAVRVSNVSNDTLTSCTFPAGFSERQIGTMVPGHSVTARVVGATSSDFFSCSSEASPLTVTEDRFPVRMAGVAVVSVSLGDLLSAPRAGSE